MGRTFAADITLGVAAALSGDSDGATDASEVEGFAATLAATVSVSRRRVKRAVPALYRAELRAAFFTAARLATSSGTSADRGLAGLPITGRAREIMAAAGLGDAVFAEVDPNPTEINLADTGLTEHAGCPVREGEKWVATQWMREGVNTKETWMLFDPQGGRL